MPFSVFSNEADTDYLLARMISSLGGSFQGRAGYFGHQACEKYLKALSVQHHKSYAETHNLIALANYCETHYAFLKDARAKDDLGLFDAFDQVGRYGAAAKHDPLSKGTPLAGFQTYPTNDLQIAGAWIWTENHLKSLDRIVFNMRTKLDFEAIKYNDGLLSIMTENKLSSRVSLWDGPTPIKDVLMKNNDYFTMDKIQPA